MTVQVGTLARAARWGLLVALLGLAVRPAVAGSGDGPTIPADERGEPLFVTSCEGGVVQDIPQGAVVSAPSPLYPPDLAARIAEAQARSTVELRSPEDLAKLGPLPDAPWVKTLREELAALAPGEGPIYLTDTRGDPWPELREEMAAIFDRYYAWCVRELPNGDIERELLVTSWPPWLS